MLPVRRVNVVDYMTPAIGRSASSWAPRTTKPSERPRWSRPLKRALAVLWQHRF